MTEQAKRIGRPPVRLLAKKRGEATYHTGKPCIRGHVAPRRTDDGCCIECKKILVFEYRSRNPEACKHRIRKHYLENREIYIERAGEWGKNNPEKRHKSKRDYANSERGQLVKYEGCARRRASKKNATPSWITQDDLTKMRHLYAEAKTLSEQTGIDYHVDHIVPLNGETVSGLHVPWNLQVLVWDQNIKKSNRMDMS